MIMKDFFFEKMGIYYRKNEFKKDLQTFVFVHGLSGSSSAWLPYENFFQEKYNILSLDLRGHGKSKKFSKYDDYKIKIFADDINELLKSLNIEKGILIGHSLGAMIIFEFLKYYAKKVSLVILLSPNYSLENRFVSKIIKPFLLPIPILNIFPFTFKKGLHVDYAKYKYASDWNIKRMFEDISNTYLRIYLYCIKQLYEVDYENFLEKINVPVLIIHGQKDTIFPIKHAIKFEEKIKNCDLVILENGNHMIIFNNIKEISGHIEKFVSSNKN